MRSMQVCKRGDLFILYANIHLFRGVGASSATRATRANHVGTRAQPVRLKKQARSRILTSQSMLRRGALFITR